MTEAALRAVEAVAREGYGRLVAIVAARTRDVAEAEDALAEAMASALRRWPVTGVPRRPEAWLVTAARRSFGHRARHAGVARAAREVIEMLHDDLSRTCGDGFPDDRLQLMFACAHPAIDPSVRTPLILQAVLGLPTDRIAAAYLMSEAAMSQFLVRAKRKIRDAGIPFALPDTADLPGRLEDVLTAIYAAYTAGWDQIGLADTRGGPLTDEALFLARLVADLAPAEPEPRGLVALILHAEARQAARRSPDGAYVPLAAQDRSLWDAARIAEAEALLTEAALARRFGRFQTEAAIQSLQAGTPAGELPDAAALALLYDVLVAQAPGLGAQVGRALAHGRLHGPRHGLAMLDAIDPAARAYQPWWAARLWLAQAAGDDALAAAARAEAIARTSDPAVQAWLARAGP
jgi:predicted RNA polymerase sigma factor